MLAISTNPRGVDGHAESLGPCYRTMGSRGLVTDHDDGPGIGWVDAFSRTGRQHRAAGIKPGRGFVEETNMDEWTEAEIEWERSTRRFEAEYQESNREKQSRGERVNYKKPGIYPIHIVPVNNGYTVSVGCQTFAFTSDDQLIGALSRYLADPEGEHKNWGVVAPGLAPPSDPPTEPGIFRTVAGGSRLETAIGRARAQGEDTGKS